MSPDGDGKTKPKPSFPRVSGDEPSERLAHRTEVAFSPRERG